MQLALTSLLFQREKTSSHTSSIKMLKKVLVMLIFMVWSIEASQESLYQGDRYDLKSGLLQSKQGNYLLGISDTSYITKARYVCIRKLKSEEGISLQVWFSDRSKPFSSDSLFLTLDHYGNFRIESQQGEEIVLYSPPKPLINVVATMLDTGNLVLQQTHVFPNKTNSTILLWQSFDFPADSLLPKMKIGINRKTGHNSSLISRLNNEQYLSPGVFSLEWEPISHELIITKHHRVYWRSGLLTKNKFFENIPKDIQSKYEYNIVSNVYESSFSFDLNPTQQGGGIDPTWVLSHKGKLSTNDREDIARADKCNGYNVDAGCQRWENMPTCRVPDEVFVPIKTDSLLYANTTDDLNMNYIFSECKENCWNDCRCLGFMHLSSINGSNGCRFFLQNSTIADSDDAIYLVYMLWRPVKKAGNIKWIISVTIGAMLIVICATILCILKRRKLKGQIGDLEALLKCNNVKEFDFQTVLAATSSFAPANKIGQGGYGPVYKGILPTGEKVAIKRLGPTSKQGDQEFMNEIVLICNLQHRNLVALLGCCIDGDEKILIYEFLENKSLDFHLFGTRRRFLDWKKRFRIIEGIADGLTYLHSFSKVNVIHRDLKAANVLLDENWVAKISDFGTAKSFSQHESRVNTNGIVGTLGYIAPEYYFQSICTSKCDVYSFGVMLVEIVTGRRVTSRVFENRPDLSLVGHAWEQWNYGGILDLMDESLNNSFNPTEVWRCIHVALLCVEEDASNPPTMEEVISMLRSKDTPHDVPKKPVVFGIEREIPEETTNGKTLEAFLF